MSGGGFYTVRPWLAGNPNAAAAAGRIRPLPARIDGDGEEVVSFVPNRADRRGRRGHDKASLRRQGHQP